MPVPSEGASEQRASQQPQPAEPSTLMPGYPGVVWVRSTALASGEHSGSRALDRSGSVEVLFLLRQVQTFIGWFVIVLFLAATLNLPWIPRLATWASGV